MHCRIPGSRNGALGGDCVHIGSSSCLWRNLCCYASQILSVSHESGSPLNCAKKRIESRTLVAAWWKEWRNPWRTRATMVVETRRGCTIRLDSPDRRRCCVIHTCKWGLQPQQELGQKWTDSHDGGPQTPPTVVIFLSLLSIKSTVLGTFILWTNTWC